MIYFQGLNLLAECFRVCKCLMFQCCGFICTMEMTMHANYHQGSKFLIKADLQIIALRRKLQNYWKKRLPNECIVEYKNNYVLLSMCINTYRALTKCSAKQAAAAIRRRALDVVAKMTGIAEAYRWHLSNCCQSLILQCLYI